MEELKYEQSKIWGKAINKYICLLYRCIKIYSCYYNYLTIDKLKRLSYINNKLDCSINIFLAFIYLRFIYLT